ncbi:hypothetical protein Trydic_g6315 [Trypoxylus dichotomus]
MEDIPQQYDEPLARIVGGKEVDISVVPYTVAIFESDLYVCVGSYIQLHWILTAAHCVEDYPPPESHVVNFDKLLLQMGLTKLLNDSDAQSRMSVTLVLHEKYTPWEYSYDIALISISKQFVLNDRVAMIPLITQEMFYDSQVAIVAGWGYEAFLGDGPARTIQAIELNIVSKSKCALLYKDDVKSLADDALCAGKDQKDACHGDSGAALAFQKPMVQIGLVSWGFGCGSDLPGIYTDVYYHKQWIINSTELYLNLKNSEYCTRYYLRSYVLSFVLLSIVL